MDYKEIEEPQGTEYAFHYVVSKEEKEEKPEQQAISKEKVGVDFLEPLYSFENQIELSRKSGILPQCISALVQGIYGVGYELKNRFPELEGDSKHKAEIEKERNRLREWLESADGTGTGNFNQLLRKVGTDFETVGNGYLEVLINSQSKPTKLVHCEAKNIRLCELDTVSTQYNQHYYDYDSRQYRTQKVLKRFRKYLFIDPVTSEYRYLKELGDPRILDHKTGTYYSAKQWQKMPKKAKLNITPANSIWHFHNYHPSSDYGLPRWIGGLNSVTGSILKEESDLHWFLNGSKADFIILSTVPLAKEAITEIKSYLKDSAKMDNAHKALVLVPKSMPHALMEGNRPQEVIKIVFFPHDRDANYIEYDRNNIKRVISACGLSPLHVGISEDLNKAIATSFIENVENNTFLPSREIIDSFINMKLLPMLGIKYHKYVSQASTRQSISDKAQLLRLGKEMGLTQRELRNAFSSAFDVKLSDSANEEWMDLTTEQAHAQAQQKKDNVNVHG